MDADRDLPLSKKIELFKAEVEKSRGGLWPLSFGTVHVFEHFIPELLTALDEARKKALKEAAEEADSHIISNPDDTGWDLGYNKAVTGIGKHIRQLANKPAPEAQECQRS